MAEEMKVGTTIKAEDNAIFIKSSQGEYFQLEYTTQLNITSESETEEKKFIAFKSPTVFSKSTKFALSNDLYTIKGNKDFEFFFPLWLNLVNEQPADLDVIIAYKCKGDPTAGYSAWHFPKTKLMFTGYDAPSSTLSFDFNFGDGEVGLVKMVSGKPAFTNGAGA